MKKFLSVLLAVMMVLSTVSFAAPSLAGTVDTAVETPLEIEVKSEEATLATEVAEGEYGALVAKFTFDDLTADTDWTTAARTVTSAATGTSRLTDTGGIFGSGEHMNATSSSVPFIYDDGKLSSITVKERASGDNYLELKGSGTNGSFGVRDYNGGGLAKQGHLILTADVLSAANAQPFSKGYFKRTGSNTFDMYETIFGEVTPGEWSQIVISCDDTHLQELSKADGYISAYNATANYIYLIENLAADEVVGIDNLAIWWLPASTATVTVDNGDVAADKEISLGYGYYSVAEIKAAMNVDLSVEGYYLKGVKTSADGETLKDGVLINGDTTLYAVWGKINVLDSLEFTSSKEGVSYNRGVTTTWDSTLGALKIDYSTWSDTTYVNYNNSNPGDSIKFDNIPGSKIRDIRIRLRFDNFAADSFNSILYPYYDGTIDTTTYTSISYPIVDGEWFELSLKNQAGNFANLLNGNLTSLRFDMSGSCDADTIIYIDYIRIIGDNLPQISVVSGNDSVEDIISTYDVDTTVGDVLNKLDLSSYSGFDFPKSLMLADGTILAADELVADYVEDEDTLTVVWGKYDTFGFDFDSVSGTKDVYPVGGGEGNEIMILSTVDADEGEEGTYLVALTDTIFDDTETARYGLYSDRGQLHIEGINIPAGELSRLIIKLRFEDIPAAGEYYTVRNGVASTTASTFDPTAALQYSLLWSGTDGGDTGTAVSAGLYGKYTMPSDGSWITLAFDNTTVSTRTDLSRGKDVNLSETGIDHLRIDFPSCPQGLKIVIDEVIFVGQPLTEYTLVDGDTKTPVYFSSTTSVADVLANLETPDETLIAKAIKYGDTYLTGDDTLEDVPEYAEIEIIYVSNIIKSYEFNTTSTEGVNYNRDVNEYTENGYLVLDYTNATQTNNSHPGDTVGTGGIPAGQLKDIQFRIKYIGFAPDKFQHVIYPYWDGTARTASGQYSSYTFTGSADTWYDISLADKFANFDTQYAGGNLTSLRLDMSGDVGDKANKIYIDYIRFIGDAPSIALVDMGDVADTVMAKFTSITTVDDLIDSIGYTGKKSIVGLATTEGGEAVAGTTLVADIVDDFGTLYAVFADNEWYGDYGYKVWSIDFDDATTGAISGKIAASTFGYEINPAFNARTNANLQLSSGASDFEIVEENGNKYLSVTAASRTSSGMFYVENGDVLPFSNIDGHFVFTYDVLSDVEYPAEIMFNAKTIEETQHRYDAATAGEWSTFAAYYPKNEIYWNYAHTASLDSITKISLIKFQQGTDVATGDIINVDNLTLWYVPKTVDVTVKASGNAAYKDTVLTVSPAGTSIDDLLGMIDGDLKKPVAVSLTEGGAPLTTLASIVEPTELYVEWEDISLLDASLEFNTSADANLLATKGELRNNASATLTVKDNTANGYATINFAVPESADGFADGTYKYEFCYDTGFFVPWFNAGTTDAPNTLDLEDIEAIQVKMRYNFPEGFADETGVIKYLNLKLGGEAEFNTEKLYAPAAMYSFIDGTAVSKGQTYSTLTTVADADGEWLLVNIDPTTLGVDGASTGTLTDLRFDFFLPDGTTLDIDYIRFIGEDAKAPVTLEDKTALRKNSGDEDYDNAIRFQASMTDVTEEKSTDIGWLVSTEAFLGENELTMDFVAGLEAAQAKKVITAYQRQDGTDKVSFFDSTDDTNPIFAAFLYNIPEENALDYVVVRPFVKVGGEYLYGDTITTRLYDWVVAPYVTILTADDSNYDTIDEIDAYFAEGYAGEDAEVIYEAAFTPFDEGGEEFLAYNDAYDALEDENQKAYIATVLKAFLG